MPRSALLASWGSAVLTGRAGLDQARAAIERTDEPHQALGRCIGNTLTDLLTDLSQSGTLGLRLALPVPGDVLGLPGPAPLNVAALEIGECVSTVGGLPLLLMPWIERFGSAIEPGFTVTWQVYPAERAAGHQGDLRAAEQALQAALTTSVDLLDRLDLARARPDAADRMDDLRHGPGPSELLPPGTSPRAVRVIDLGWRIGGITALAAEDDGAAVSGWEATARADALRELRTLARRALVAAINEAADRPR